MSRYDVNHFGFMMMFEGELLACVCVCVHLCVHVCVWGCICVRVSVCVWERCEREREKQRASEILTGLKIRASRVHFILLYDSIKLECLSKQKKKVSTAFTITCRYSLDLFSAPLFNYKWAIEYFKKQKQKQKRIRSAKVDHNIWRRKKTGKEISTSSREIKVSVTS